MNKKKHDLDKANATVTTIQKFNKKNHKKEGSVYNDKIKFNIEMRVMIIVNKRKLIKSTH